MTNTIRGASTPARRCSTAIWGNCRGRPTRTNPDISFLRAQIRLSCIGTPLSQTKGYRRAIEIPTPCPYRERNHAQPRQTWGQQCHGWQAWSVDEYLAKGNSEHIWVAGLGDELSDEAEIIDRVRKRLRTSGPGSREHHVWASHVVETPVDVRLRQSIIHHLYTVTQIDQWLTWPQVRVSSDTTIHGL